MQSRELCINFLRIAVKVLAHPEARKYVAGVAVHWYSDLLIPPNVLSAFHGMFPDHFILATEACEGKKKLCIVHREWMTCCLQSNTLHLFTTGDKPWQESVSLGSWERLESYAHNIIEVKVLK